MITKSNGWTSISAVKIICFILILASAFTFLNGMATLIQRQDRHGVPSSIIFEDLSGHSYFSGWRIHNAHVHAVTITQVSSRESIQAGNYLTWHEYPQGMELIDNRGWVSGFIHRDDENFDNITRRLERTAIESHLADFDNAVEYLISIPGLRYFLRTEDNGTVFQLANTYDNRNFFTAQPVNIVLDDLTPDGASHTATIYLAFDRDFIDAQMNFYRQVQRLYMFDVAVILASILAAFVFMVILLLGAGRRRAVEGIHFSNITTTFLRFSFSFLDLSLLGVTIWTALVLTISIDFGFLGLFFQNTVIMNLIFAIMSVVVVTPIVIWLVGFAERAKAGRFWRHTLIWFLVNKISGTIKSLWAGVNLTFKVALIGVISFGLLLFTGLAGLAGMGGFVPLSAFIFSLCIVYFLLRYARRLHKLEQGAKKAAEGEYLEIDVKGGELGNIAHSISNISSGISAAVEHRMKSERLKTELITNVSHDIRTPLTSIITYIDLLKHEGLDCEKAPEYLDVLEQKSQRLKTLTDELFEAAKASTGNIEVNISSLDLTELINQVLGELDSVIKSSTLDLRVNMPERVFAKADGRLMCRVLENLMANVFKYALDGSRVYFDVRDENGQVCIDIKNISANELNVNPSELTERFKRGDASRSDGGSGLGLSIVQSFVTAQNGTFQITIDGDLFKASVCLPGT